MFAIHYHESIPLSSRKVQVSVGHNYYYNQAVVANKFHGQLLFTYSLPIPYGPQQDVEIPMKIGGLIRDEPYRDSDTEFLYDGEITQFVPIFGHKQLVELPSLGNGKLVTPTTYENVDGPDTFTYKWITTEKKTVSGTAHWIYRGKRYSRDWTKTYSNQKEHTATVRCYDFIRMAPRKVKRHLHHCDHSYVTGDLWLASRGLGFHGMFTTPVSFQSTWPHVAKGVEWHLPKDPNEDVRSMDLPLDQSLWAGGTVEALPRLYRSFIAFNDGTAPILDHVYPVLAGLAYVGSELFSHDEGFVGTGYVYCLVSPIRKKKYDGTPLEARLTYYHWGESKTFTYRYGLFKTNTLTVPLPITHKREVVEELVRTTYTSNRSRLTWKALVYQHQLTFAETPTAELHPRGGLLESAYAKLWRAVLPQNMERVYKQTVGHAGQDALLATKVLNINSLMYLKDFTTIRELCDSYADLLKRGINPKTVSGAYLASHYGVRLTVADTREIIDRVKREIVGLAEEYQYSYGHSSSSLDGPVGKIDVQGNVSVLFTLVDKQTLKFLNALARWDFLPTPRVIWDMIPYSFVIDWVVPIGKTLEHWDRLITQGTIDQKRCCWSLKTKADLSAELLTPALLKQGARYYSNSEHLQLVGYRRAYQRYAPSPDALLDLLDISPRWSDSRLYEISSLTIQRFS